MTFEVRHIVMQERLHLGFRDQLVQLNGQLRTVEHEIGAAVGLVNDDRIALHPLYGDLPFDEQERALIERILSRGFVDLGRELDPDNDGLFTWWAPWRNLRARNIGWRLDYVLASPTVAARARACVVQPDVGTSDHAPVVMTL